MVKKIYFTVIFVGLLLVSCFREPPVYNDGNLDVALYVKIVSDQYGIDEFLDSTIVTLSTTEYKLSPISDTTDVNGFVRFNGLGWANYTVLATRDKYSLRLDFGTEVIPLIKGKIIIPDNELFVDTLYMNGPQPVGLKINELYTCGPPNNFYYFYDQYFELYNSSNDTLYLDGIQFCRMGDMLENVTYIFQFPGKPLIGREYPVPPKTFVVCATTAFNHRKYVFDGRASVDLSNADWEFRNESDPTDFDNPKVPNIGNIEEGHSIDFMVALSSDVVLIADGSDDNYLDGIDINTVIDCVEYSAISTHKKEIEEELDYGWAGIGLGRYSGKSLERKSPGFDTNNSTIDFVIIPAPTVGYHHEGSK